MIEFYVMRIQMGRMELKQVPARWRVAVTAALNAKEVVTNG